MNIEACEKVTAVGFTTASSALRVLEELNDGVYLTETDNSYSSEVYDSYKVTITVEKV